MIRPRLVFGSLTIWAGVVSSVAISAAPVEQARQSAGPPLTTPAPSGPRWASGEALYRDACITCHAADGTGAPSAVVGFETPLPDFTDCAFATAEPDPDWQAVVHQGGPVRGLAREMPAFGDALSDDEIAMVVGYLRGFCAEPAWPRGDLNFPRALFTEKAFPENEAVWTTVFTGGAERSFRNELLYEKRFGARTQVELAIPVDILQYGPSDWATGLGDVAIGIKRALLSNASRGTIGSAGFELTMPTGKQAQGFGLGVPVYEPFVLLGQALPRDSFLQVHAGLELPARNRKAKEAFVRTAVGTTIASDRGFGRAWSPQVELLWARPLTGVVRDAEWDVVPQLQVTLSKLQHVMVAAGVRIPINRRHERGNRFVTYLLWDWYDGGFFEFWK